MSTYIPDKPCKRGHYLRYTKLNGTGTCVECAKIIMHQNYLNNKQKRIIAAAQWTKKNPQRAKEIRRKNYKPSERKIRYESRKEIENNNTKLYYTKNKSKIQKLMKNWRENNWGTVLAICAKRRAAKLRRTPKWMTSEDYSKIEDLYYRVKLLTQATGIKYHVDHYYPLQGKTVSGLHVLNNLRVIEAKENLSKFNHSP